MRSKKSRAVDFGLCLLALYALFTFRPPLSVLEIVDRRVEWRMMEMKREQEGRTVRRQAQIRLRQEQLCQSKGWFPLLLSDHLMPGERPYTGNEPDCQAQRLVGPADHKSVVCCTVRPTPDLD